MTLIHHDQTKRSSAKMMNSKTSEASHRGRRYLPESSLGGELEQSEHENPVCIVTIPPAQFRIVLTLLRQLSPTPSLQSPPGFFKKVTRLFKHPEAVYMAFVSDDNASRPPTSLHSIVVQSPDEPPPDTRTNAPKADTPKVLSLVSKVFHQDLLDE